jgi:hypothetical protein
MFPLRAVSYGTGNEAGLGMTAVVIIPVLIAIALFVGFIAVMLTKIAAPPLIVVFLITIALMVRQFIVELREK